VALYNVNATTDLTAKGKRLASIHCFSTAGGTITLANGVGGTTLYVFNVGANADKSVVFDGPSFPVFTSGVSVVKGGTDCTATLDIV
jgi:hypothetical protein